MNEFLKLFDEQCKKYPLLLEITHSSNWVIHIEFIPHDKNMHETIITIREDNLHLCFAKAHVEFKEWLLENEGGY